MTTREEQAKVLEGIARLSRCLTAINRDDLAAEVQEASAFVEAGCPPSVNVEQLIAQARILSPDVEDAYLMPREHLDQIIAAVRAEARLRETGTDMTEKTALLDLAKWIEARFDLAAGSKVHGRRESEIIYQHILETLASAEARADQWQPIASASKDGRDLLCTWVHNGRWSRVMHVLSWFKDWYGEGKGAWVLDGDFNTRFEPDGVHETPPIDYGQPTHWMPLPAPPTEAHTAVLQLDVTPAPCHWRLDDIDGMWDGSCRVVWQLETGTPAENGMQFCPKCGGKLVTGAARE